MKLFQKTPLAFAACSLAACAAQPDPAATEAAIDEAQRAVIVQPALPAPPQLVFQIRFLSACLPDDQQAALAQQIEALVAPAFPGAKARAACVKPAGAAQNATTIGVFNTPPAPALLPSVLDDFNVLDGAPVGGIELGTFVSHAFMRSRLSDALGDQDELDVESFDVLLDEGANKLTTELKGQRNAFPGIINITIRWAESAAPRDDDALDYQPCTLPPSSIAASTSRTISGLIPDIFVQDHVPERGVLGELVDRGLFPSRVLLPSSAALPVALALNLRHDPDLIRVHASGKLKGLTAVATGFLSGREPCIKIDPPFLATGSYGIDAFDLRGPLSFAWTGQGLTPLSPSASTTKVNFTTPQIAGTLSVEITDADGASANASRAVSFAHP
ncbi:MAG: hypothetical protein MUF34_23035 [Polyangiaceae bacterium]|jgi:hypothetical protein|nr:hypothetical protein [Polyangiaceae bacterium]